MVSPGTRPLVVKIGGSTLGAEDTTLADLAWLGRKAVRLVLVHGGGPLISDWQRRLGLEPRFVRGLRVTDGPSLEVAMAVLAGLVNKQLVAGLQALGVKALGLAGVDGGLIRASPADPQLGLVGRVEGIDLSLLDRLLAAGYLPVVAPIGLYLEPTADGLRPVCLNLNADTVAGELAAALGADLVLLTDTPGVLDGTGRTVPELTPAQAAALVEGGVASGGMIPKVAACLRAVAAGGTAWVVGGGVPGSLRRLFSGEGVAGTVFRSG